MKTDLAGESALITGGGRGLGRQLALDFAARGAKVAISSRSADQLDEVRKEIEAAGGTAMTVVADVGVGSDVERMIGSVRDRFGSLDVLVNNAGSFPVGAVVDVDEAEWDQSMHVDLKSFYLCSRSALTIGGMLAGQAGHIINIASVSVRRAVPNLAIHCSFKAGVLAFSESLRREVAGAGIRVSIICPGTIDTGLVRDPVKKNYVHGESKWLSTQDVSDLVLYVAEAPKNVNLSEVTIVGA